MSQQSEAVTWLTQEAYERLQDEFDRLSGPGRADLVKKIEAAREEGDLKENGGYHAAKDEQGKQEARIRQLRQILDNARVGEAPPDSGRVAPGMIVTVTLFGDEVRFLLGSREVAASEDIEVYSEQSPLGKALLGLGVGDETTYSAPNGRRIPVKVLAAKPYAG